MPPGIQNQEYPPIIANVNGDNPPPQSPVRAGREDPPQNPPQPPIRGEPQNPPERLPQMTKSGRVVKPVKRLDL